MFTSYIIITYIGTVSLVRVVTRVTRVAMAGEGVGTDGVHH